MGFFPLQAPLYILRKFLLLTTNIQLVGPWISPRKCHFNFFPILPLFQTHNIAEMFGLTITILLKLLTIQIYKNIIAFHNLAPAFS